MEGLYRRFAIVFFVACHPGGLLLWLAGYPLVGFAIFWAGNLGIWIPTVISNRQWFGYTVTSFATSREEVWLTLDDGPDREDTGAILEILERFGAKATFFLVGDRGEKLPDEVRAIRDAGHSVGNHTQHHFSGWFWALPSRILRAEVHSCDDAFEGILGERSTLFRPPVGMKNPLLQPILDRSGLVHIGWSARGLDGIFRDPDMVLRRIRSRIRPGAILLIHQGRRDREGRLLAPILLERILRELEDRGMRCVVPPPQSYLP